MNWLEGVFAGEGFCFLVVGGHIRPQEQAKPLATPQEPGLEGKAGPDASRHPPARLAAGQGLHLTKTMNQAHLDGELPGAMQEGQPGPHKAAQQGRGSPQGHTSRAVSGAAGH